MSADLASPHRLTASDLRRLDPDQRRAVLEAAAARAEADYRDDLDLTAFEAYGKEDLHVESANTETR